jgi:hypothetical protein
MPVGPVAALSIVKTRRVPIGLSSPSPRSATSSAVVFEPTSMQAQRVTGMSWTAWLVVLEDCALALVGAALEPALNERADSRDEREENDEAETEERDDLVVDVAVPTLAVVPGEGGCCERHQNGEREKSGLGGFLHGAKYRTACAREKFSFVN